MVVSNVKFLVKRKNQPKHTTLFWDLHVIHNINVPDNIYNEHCQCCMKIHNYPVDLLSAYLIGWFYKYNEDVVHLEDIETVLVYGREI